MKPMFTAVLVALLLSTLPLLAQPNRRPAQQPKNAAPSATTNPGDYASDITVVHEAQQQALEQAQQMLTQGENVRDRVALESAIKQMELAQNALTEAKKSPDKLPAAIAAEQAAYQALLKLTPREYRMTQQQRNAQQSQQNGNTGQASQRQMDQLDMQREENRYETERQASTPQTSQQREQTQTADRLKELSQRQQDLNGRLRELQTALQAATTDKEREEIQRQLKRLQDEQRQMLANVDELSQKLAQSPNASSQAETQKQLEQTRSDMERAAQEMERKSASGALAAGTRAQEAMQNLRDDLRKQASSQFTEQMQQLRAQARDLMKQQDEIKNGLDTLNNGEKQSLDNSAERKQIVQQLEKQQGSLTNLLTQMRNVTEQAEATEPLLSKQLYDTLRRADQMHTESLLEMGSQLTERGFLPQASQVERATRTNITELVRSVERAADSVLGSEADALRFAQKELDDLTRQVERETIGAGTNEAARAAGGIGGTNGVGSQTNHPARVAGRGRTDAGGDQDTNSVAGANGRSPGNESQASGNNPQNQQPGNRGQQPNGNGTNDTQASADSSPPGQRPGARGNNPANGNGAGANQPPPNRENNNAGQASAPSQPNRTGQEPGQEPGQGQAVGGNNPGEGSPRAAQARTGGNPGGGGAQGGGDRLRQLAIQLGAGGDRGGPITGGDYVNWAERLRDVEQVVEPADLQNQLATVRERAATMRTEYRERGQKPQANAVRDQLLLPLTQARVWLQEELARKEKSGSLVPLDRDPVPDNYTELVKQYYEKLGSAQ